MARIKGRNGRPVRLYISPEVIEKSQKLAAKVERKEGGGRRKQGMSLSAFTEMLLRRELAKAEKRKAR